MIEAGGGHKMPALAVYESLLDQFPGKYDIKVLDFMKDVGCGDIDSQHKAIWKYLLSHPLLTKSIQTFDFVTGPVNLQIYRKKLVPFYKAVTHYIDTERPDLIFSTHFFNTMGISNARKNCRFKPILVNYLTEIFDFDSYWYLGLKDVDYYIVSSGAARDKLLKKKYPSEKIQVFPYPVRESFLDLARSREEILHSLGIDPAMKTLLITQGSEGITSAGKLIDALAEQQFPLNIIVVTGRNKVLLKGLEQQKDRIKSRLNLIPLGFVDNMNELIFVSDFCFIKPGPATTWEVLSFRKPIIFGESAQLSENPNIRFVCASKLGWYAGGNIKKSVGIVRMMMDDRVLKQYRDSYGQVNIENGSAAIARFLEQVLSNTAGHRTGEHVEGLIT